MPVKLADEGIRELTPIAAMKKTLALWKQALYNGNQQ